MMDQSYSESDVSISPSQILGRLQVLKQLQILQRGKLQNHRLQYDNSPEISSNITEIVSQFSNSTSYNTFRSLLQSSQETSEVSPHSNINQLFLKDNLQNVIEGVSVLNLSEESEFFVNSASSRNSASPQLDSNIEKYNVKEKNVPKKQISLDDMPILSPKKDFETLITEKLNSEKDSQKISQGVKLVSDTKKNIKKPFLKRGEGMARFGLQKNDLVIQNTKTLPWKKNKSNFKTPVITKSTKNKQAQIEKVPVQILHKETKPTHPSLNKCSTNDLVKKISLKVDSKESKTMTETSDQSVNNSSHKALSNINVDINVSKLEKDKNPIKSNKGKTWASVLTKEQDEFLRQLKQSEYYKNFISPAKSIVSEISCNQNFTKFREEKEAAEQNLFELIENKVTHESFNIDNSFFTRFLQTNIECSGESTPLVMQKCLYKNPNLMYISPDISAKKRNETSSSVIETCNSECTECSETSSLSSCCSCQTVTHDNTSCSKEDQNNKQDIIMKHQKPKLTKESKNEKSHNDTLTAENEVINSNMAEMNAKLIATSELLKDRLRELEDEIDTFRKENANLTKMREEVEIERQKLFEEKTTFEQKFNEDKILSEYYLAEEKEKLNKQKQTYERYVREMRGKLSKKEKDEVVNLKKEINDLKDEIRLKDTKSTSTIARLRNQIKIIEKDKKELKEEIEKLTKENRRIQHSNEITRRLTNLKYLEQINKKLSNMTSRDSQSEVELDSNIKYKAFEIERQSRVRKNQMAHKGTVKQRAKSVPNLHVTSRYAKYFSQKDSLSDKEKNNTLSNGIDCDMPMDNDHTARNKSQRNSSDQLNNYSSDSEEDNSLEKIYNSRFKSISPETLQSQRISDFDLQLNTLSDGSTEDLVEKMSRNSSRKSTDKCTFELKSPDHKLHSRNSKSHSISTSNTLSNTSKSPTIFCNKNYGLNDYNDANRVKSPVSDLSNHSSSYRTGTVINKENYFESIIPGAEPASSKTSFSKTNLNPTEIKKPDGTRELRFPNGNIKFISADGKYSKFVYYNGDIKENFYNEGRIKYFYSETKTFHTTHPDGLEVLEFPDGQVEKRYRDGSSEIKLPNGSIRYYDPKNEHVREEWRFPDGTALTISANGEQRIVFANGQIEVHAKDHKRREFPDGSVKLVYNDGTSETRYSSGRVRIKDKHGNLIMDSAPD